MQEFLKQVSPIKNGGKWKRLSNVSLSFLHHGLQRNESGPDTLNSKHFKWATKACDVPSEGHETLLHTFALGVKHKNFSLPASESELARLVHLVALLEARPR